MRKKLLSMLALLCLTVSGAWARLIEDGKALLAIDPDQPTRIVSTDKKAQKAGGLCLALKGVPVWDNGTLTVKSDFERNGFRAIITYDRRNKAAHAIAEMQGKPACFSLH